MTAGQSPIDEPWAAHAVVAGAGLAASLVACELRTRGFAVWMLELSAELRPRPLRPRVGGIECLPFEVAGSLERMGLASVLARARAVATAGFENAWNGSPPVVLERDWISVDREALAQALRAEALDRGAKLVRVARAPCLVAGAGPFTWNAPGLPQASRIAIDATGRAAVWSRPVVRRAARTATLYRGPGAHKARRGRIVRVGCGWAYALHHSESTTVGVVGATGARVTDGFLAPEIATALDLGSPRSFVFDGRCAAHAQWAVRPISATRDRVAISVGDAALAYEPIAGQGVRFAIASSSAAAASIATLRGANEGDCAFQAATAYYDELVAGARRRHGRELRVAYLEDERRPGVAPFTDGAHLMFGGAVVSTGIRRGNSVIADSAIRLADEGLVRWLGTFDLLELRAIADVARPARDIEHSLRARGMSSSSAVSLIRWCVEQKVLLPAQDG